MSDGDTADGVVSETVVDEMADVAVDDALASSAKSLAVAVYQHHGDAAFDADDVSRMEVRARTIAGVYADHDDDRADEASEFLGAAVEAARDVARERKKEAFVGDGTDGEGVPDTYVVVGRVEGLRDDYLDAGEDPPTVGTARAELTDAELADRVAELDRVAGRRAESGRGGR